MTGRLAYRTSALADLYLFLRAAAQGERRPGAEWDAALEPLRVTMPLVSPRDTIMIDGMIAEAESLDELREQAPSLPDDADGVPLREVVGAGVRALELAGPLYWENAAEPRRSAIRHAIARLERILEPVEDACLEFLASGLGLARPDVEIPVFLVVDAPRPGAFTSRSRRTGAACFVSISEHPGTDLVEMVLHEAGHALTAFGELPAGSPLHRLEEAVLGAGIARPDPRAELAHALLFVHAAETVRRLIDPLHTHYGDAHGYYAKVPVSAVVRRHWTAHLDGDLTPGAAVDAIVTEAL